MVRSHAQDSLSGFPVDELQAYAAKLGLEPDPHASRDDLLALINRHQAMLNNLSRQALLDICVWARRPVRKSSTKEELVKEIVTIKKMNFKHLSEPGLMALCRLRRVQIDTDADKPTMVKALRNAEPVGHYVHRKWRRFIGNMITNVVADDDPRRGEYQFLPEVNGSSLKDEIEEAGVVGGIKRKIKGAADDYVREKLDEIEHRIDLKLDEIDQRLNEWRDKEVSNRLKIIKMTLITTILVALLSLGYDYIRQSDDRFDSNPVARSEPQNH